MEKRCWDLNPDCIAKKGTKCPVYNSDINCWDYDWLAVLKEFSGNEQKTWKEYMLEKCPKCGAFMPQMNKTLERVKAEL